MAQEFATGQSNPLSSARVARQAFSWLRRLPERMLHPLRRRRALHQLARRPAPARVLFVCHGNICRSPYAAARALSCEVQSDSAGLEGPGRASPVEAQEVAAARGLDLSRHCSKVVTVQLVAQADLVCVMDESQRRTLLHFISAPAQNVFVLGDLDPHPIMARAIPDPIGRPRDAFESSYDRIDRCVRALADILTARRPP